MLNYHYEILNWSFQKRIYEIDMLKRFITFIATFGNLWVYYDYLCKIMKSMKSSMFSIMKLMMSMRRYVMWKVNSHIMMLYPLWSLMLRAIPIDYDPLWSNVKERTGLCSWVISLTKAIMFLMMFDYWS